MRYQSSTSKLFKDQQRIFESKYPNNKTKNLQVKCILNISNIYLSKILLSKAVVKIYNLYHLYFFRQDVVVAIFT